jgi:hypothetical protein
MTKRTTVRHVRDAVARIRREYDDPLVVECAYGRPAILREYGAGKGTAIVSPRLTPRELLRWVFAYRDGFARGRAAAIKIKTKEVTQ